MTMASAPGGWPKKSHELFNRHMDSRVWNEFKFRDDDIVIATWGKSGTTWTQQIVSQLIFGGAEDVELQSPWLDHRLTSKEENLAAVEAQQHRRFIKTHLAVDTLVYSPRAKYIYIGRDGRDVVWSMYNQHSNVTDQRLAALNALPGDIPPFGRAPGSVRQYFNTWLERDGYPWWPFWHHVRGWWEIRDLPNMLLLHYEDMKADMPGEIRRIAAFLDIPIDEERWPAIVEHCSFDYMRAHGDAMMPRLKGSFSGGAKTFINKGTNGRWRETLTAEECRRYEDAARRELGDDCAAWLESGRVNRKDASAA